MCRIFVFSVFCVWGSYCGVKFTICKLSVSTLHFHCEWKLSMIFVTYVFLVQKPTLCLLPDIDSKINSSSIMERYLNILEAPGQQQKETFDEEKASFINSKISISNYFDVPQATYLGYTNVEKSRMFKVYYNELVNRYYGPGKNFCLYRLICLVSFLACFSIFGLIFFWFFF